MKKEITDKTRSIIFIIIVSFLIGTFFSLEPLFEGLLHPKYTEKRFDEEDLIFAADSLDIYEFGSGMEKVRSAMEGYFHNELYVSGSGYSGIEPLSDMDFVSGERSKFPIDEITTEYYEDRLVSVTYRCNALYSEKNEGSAADSRSRQIMSAFEEKALDMGYSLICKVPLYENNSTVRGSDGAGFRQMDEVSFTWRSSFNYNFSYDIWNSLESKLLSDGHFIAFRYYLSEDGTKVITIIPHEICGDSMSVGMNYHLEEYMPKISYRYAIVDIVYYDLEAFDRVDEEITVGKQSSYLAAPDLVESMKKIEEMGAEEYFEEYGNILY